MRVIDTETGQFVEIDPETTDEYDKTQKTVFAILSHTWDTGGEQTYEELKKIQQRYHPRSESQTPPSEDCANVAETDGATSPTLVRALPTALVGRLTESEVEALLRLVAETFGLPLPAPSTPSPSDASYGPVQGPPLSKPSPRSIWEDPKLSPKIRNACRVARTNGYRYIWIDSCCIDKSSSSELSEAINSMYKWYGLAKVCYAYLADVPPGKDHHATGSAFCESRWFHRGWTLQELIAPLEVEFLSNDWAPIGSKHTLVNSIESLTKIDYKALLHVEPLDKFSVAQRLSWAAERETTRVEDAAYALLGIFDINMPTLYGEGGRAFRRLQEQIIQRIPDQSLFAWRDICPAPPWHRDPKNTLTSLPLQCLGYDDEERDFFPQSPWHFKHGNSMRIFRQDTTTQLLSSPSLDEYISTPYGIRTQLQMIPLTQGLLQCAVPGYGYEDIQVSLGSEEGRRWYLAILQCEHVKHPGHLLGRVCYTTISESGGRTIIYPGYVLGHNYPDLFPLSPRAIKHFHQQTELKSVYIPHPRSSAALPVSSHLRSQPYTTIKLVLLRETCDALRSGRGYLADLSDPDLPPDHPTTQRLTLSNDEHTIVVEFQHTLQYGGTQFTIEAEVKISARASRVQLDSAPGSNREDRYTMSWEGSLRWYTEIDHERVDLSSAGAGRTLTMDLGLDFVGCGYYFLRVDVLREELSACRAVELEGDKGGEGQRHEADDSPLRTSGIEEPVGREQEGGDGMPGNVEV
uniref:Zn(2)-C6 fungal-type domain-containing protein n=1 Tax=Ganoderma boninense TaxID=34458 RepID=A0A5K1K1G0_9APHY|nr:Zn(2)-C6 fungal-type domain-containing protein [Ganoderma boninense]